MRKIILHILFILSAISFFSCKQTHKQKIEIYLPKHRIDPINLIPITELKENAERIKNMTDEDIFELSKLKYDTINQREIHAGDFIAKESDLMTDPLVKDSEIINFDFNNNELLISSEGTDRIRNLEPEFSFHNQFVLTIDKKPILTGYFRSTFSSWPVDSYCIDVMLTKSKYLSNGKEGTFQITKGEFYKKGSTNRYVYFSLKDNLLLYKALKDSDRIKNKVE